MKSAWRKRKRIMSIIGKMMPKQFKNWRLGADWLIAGAYPGFRKLLGVFQLPLDGLVVYHRSLPRNLLGFPNNAPVLISTPGWRGTVIVKCLAQEHNTISRPARARTQTALSRDERTNYEATVPYSKQCKLCKKKIVETTRFYKKRFPSTRQFCPPTI